MIRFIEPIPVDIDDQNDMIREAVEYQKDARGPVSEHEALAIVTLRHLVSKVNEVVDGFNALLASID